MMRHVLAISTVFVVLLSCAGFVAENAAAAPQFVAETQGRAYPGIGYSEHLRGTGGEAPYAFQLDSAPTGMRISRDGTITWTPAAGLSGQSFPIVVRVTDKLNQSATQNFTVSVTTAGFYFVAPSGDDTTGQGTIDAPWRTFSKSYTVLHTGDTVILLDGTYNEQLSPTVSGQAGAPITFRSKNSGKAIIQMTSPGAAIRVYSDTTHTRGYLTFDGLIARGNGENPAIQISSGDNVTEEQMTNNIIVRNTGAFGSANLNNVVVFSLGNNLRDSLCEDVWAYGFGRKALQVFGCMRVTVRRAVLRYDYWDGSGYKPNDPRVTFSGYNTIDSVFENIIALDSAPTPPGRSADRAAFVSSGNETPAIITGSARNKYLGLLALNNFGNGLEVNGGSGDSTHDNVFKDMILWESKSYGSNIQSNDKQSTFSNMTIGYSGLTGFRINQYPQYPIVDERITYSFSTHNLYGFSYSSASVSLFNNNSATFNANGGSVEPQYAPTMEYLVRPLQVSGHERGGTMYYRYVDGALTDVPLWPWPNEDLIKQCMCDPDDLSAVGRVASNGAGWEPKWSQTGKTLTQYVWEYLGNTIPCEIYGTCGVTPPAAPTGLSVW